MSALTTVKETIRKHQLIDREQSILIALSGGPDSVALLRLLVRLRRSWKLSLGALYINHGLRPRAATSEEHFCQSLCDRHQIDLTIVREDIQRLARSEKKNLEECGRDFRYATFTVLAKEDGYDRIALGHHADDCVETVLFRIIRGTGPAGLIGIPARRDNVIRPLLSLTKREILDYLGKLGQDFCIDRSNLSLRFSRNYLRQKLLPDIRLRLNPQVDSALLGLADLIAPEEQFLEGWVVKAFRKAVEISPGGKLALDLTVLGGYDQWLRRRLLRRCLRTISDSSLAPGRELVDRLDRLCCKGRKGMSLPDRLQAVCSEKQLVLFKRSLRRRTFRAALEPEKSLRLDYPRLLFKSRIEAGGDHSLVPRRRSNAVTLDWDKLRPPLVVRNIGHGDAFRPLGMKGSKKVSDYLIDRKVPRVFREEIPLLCDADGIVWLVGYEIADRVKIDASTGKVFTVEYRTRKPGSSPAV